MPKSKAEHAEAIKNVTSAWVSRGYRHDYLVANQSIKDLDPAGELAYQRAFAEAVKKVPPRLPNPAHYPNSSSAVALIQKQNLGIFNARQSDAPNPKYEQPIADMYWRSKEDEQKYRSASSTPPTTNGQPHISPVQRNGYLPPPMPHNDQNGHSTPVQSRSPPLLMEPKLGAPMGPPSRFR